MKKQSKNIALTSKHSSNRLVHSNRKKALRQKIYPRQAKVNPLDIDEENSHDYETLRVDKVDK